MTEFDIDIIRWTGSSVRFTDQTLLPRETRVVETDDYRDMLEAIRSLRVRGAPLIGIAAAYGVLTAAHSLAHDAESGQRGPAEFTDALLKVCDEFAATRPTAVNLFLALENVRAVLRAGGSDAEILERLTAMAGQLHKNEILSCEAIGRHGAALLPQGARVITHCNTGALATGGEGTAFAVLLHAHRQGKDIHVYAGETRPLLQGARLTMWELQHSGIPSTLITDSTAAMLMQTRNIDAVITGADRIAANGDTANKIGTYGLAVAARHHGIPFYIAAPTSTLDLALESGDVIPIEERAAEEVTGSGVKRSAPEHVRVYAPAFDVTPAALITAIRTERGVFSPPFRETLRTQRT